VLSDIPRNRTAPLQIIVDSVSLLCWCFANSYFWGSGVSHAARTCWWARQWTGHWDFFFLRTFANSPIFLVAN